MGAASIKVTAAERGTPFWISRRITGIMAQSQTGKKTPANTASTVASTALRENSLVMNDSGTRTWITAETNTPRRIKGNACSRMLTKTVIKVCARARYSSPAA